MFDTVEIDRTWTLSDVLRHFPTTTVVFQRFDLDTRGGGAATVAEAALAEGVRLEVLLQALRSQAARQ